MKRILIIAIIATIGGFSVMAQNNPVNNQTPTNRDHRNLIVDGTMSTNIQLSFDDVNGVIVVLGLGENESYQATVASTATPQMILISEFVDAGNNIIDVSTLPDGVYFAKLIDPIMGKAVITCKFTVINGIPEPQRDLGKMQNTTILEK